MKLLYIADFLYFTDGGAHVSACAHKNTLIKIYGKENVDIIALTGPRDDTPQYSEIEVIRGERNKVKLWVDCCLGYTTYLNKKGIKRIISKIHKNNYNFIFIDNSIFGKLVKSIKLQFPQIPVITYYHDVKASLAAEWKKNAPLVKKIVYQSMIKSEYINQQYSDVNLTLNPRENLLYEKYYKKKSELQLGVYMNINLEDEYIHSECPLNDELDILFIGSYYKPNVDGIIWYINKVIPLLNIKTHLTVAGSHMDLLKYEISKIPENVSIYGHVDDLSELYMRADVIISPIFEGGGMKVKVTHAIGFGKVVVGTDESFEGYQENINKLQWNKYFYRCNDAKEFANALNIIHNDKSLRKYNKDIWNYYNTFYSENYAQKTIKAAVNLAKTKCRNN